MMMREGISRTLVVGFLSLLLGLPRPAAAIDSCSVSGGYNLDGFALGDTEVLGFLTFTPNAACTGGGFTGSVTIRQDGNPPFNFTPNGSYVVDSDTTINLIDPGLVTLTGIVSLVANNHAHAIHLVGDAG